MPITYCLIKNMKYTTILFDLDGTILNTVEDLNGSLNFVLKKYGLPLHSVAETTAFLGNGIRRRYRNKVQYRKCGHRVRLGNARYTGNR